jgi:hypothetical protein
MGLGNLSYFSSFSHHILPDNGLHVPRLDLQNGTISKDRSVKQPWWLDLGYDIYDSHIILSPFKLEEVKENDACMVLAPE